MFANSAHQKGQAVAHVVEMSTSSTGVLVSTQCLDSTWKTGCYQAWVGTIVQHPKIRNPWTPRKHY